MNNLQKYFSPEDVTILLEESNIVPITIDEKEANIREGVHYSEMIIKELPLSNYHLQIAAQMYDQTLSDNVQRLANTIHQDAQGEDIVLLSLVRAGIPLGIGINQAIKSLGCERVKHYAISIIRDVGIDHVAMQYVLEQHPGAEIYFVDGWTGKGSISVQLYESLTRASYWKDREIKFVVYSDPAKTAWLSVEESDIALPFGLYNSVGFGLLSRTVAPKDEYSFHGAALQEHLKDYIQNRPVWKGSEDRSLIPINYFRPTISDVGHMISRDWDLPLDRVKVSQLEVLRSILRRKPSCVFLNKDGDEELIIKLIRTLCEKQGIKILYSSKVLKGYKAASLLGPVPILGVY